MRYDMLVIGSGPAGQKAAIQAAKLGKRVGIVERREVVGGVCINTGTIPSKSLREAVLHLSGLFERSFYGSSYRVKERVTFEDLLKRTNGVIQNEIEVIRSQLSRNGVDLLPGTARFVDAHTLEVTRSNGDVESHQGDCFVIAVGTRPTRPPDVVFQDGLIVDSDGILRLERIPKTLIVVGAGVVGIEYTSIFSTLGVEVTLIEKRPTMLEFVDREILEHLRYQLRGREVTFRLGEEVEGIVAEGNRVRARLRSGKVVLGDALLYSAGRTGATADLGLENIGLVADDRGRLKVDGHFRTSVPNVYAVGDVIGFPSLASSAMEQGRLAACAAFGGQCPSMPEHFPYGIFSIPEISMVGKTEEELTAESVPYEVGIARYREISRGQLIGDETGMLKLLFHRETRRLLGVHAIGTDAAELIHVGQAVLSFGGTLDYFVRTVFNYPTLAECYKVAALDALNKLGG